MTDEQMNIFAEKRVHALKLLIEIESNENAKVEYQESLTRWESFLKGGKLHDV